MKLINSPSFNGYPVLSKRGELIEAILLGNEGVITKGLHCHNRLTVIRFELKFPVGYTGCVEIVSKFFESLKYRIKSDLLKKGESKGRYIHSEVGYVWVKELSGQRGWHYHATLTLNHDVYNSLGLLYGTNENMFNRIYLSWASALGYHPDNAKGLVHIPENPIYKLDCNSVSIHEDIHDVLYRLSYLAKIKTKPYSTGLGMRFFGTSQR